MVDIESITHLINEGRMSVRYACNLLDITIEDLCELLKDYDVEIDI